MTTAMTDVTMVTQTLTPTVGHNLVWTTHSKRIQSIWKKGDRSKKTVRLHSEVILNVARKEIGVQVGDRAKVDHIWMPDPKVGPYAGHVLVLHFGDKTRDGHPFALSEVTSICDS